MTTLIPIGYVHNACNYQDKPGLIKQEISTIEIEENYAEGLINILEHECITVVFGLDLIDEVHLTENRRAGGKWGIFACRSQYRPNHIGVTNCKLLSCEGRILTVQGLDACNLSPVYDLKCPDTSEQELLKIHNNILLKNPRHDIDYCLRNDLFYPLLLSAGQLTGVIDYDLKLGVLAGIYFVQMAKEKGCSYTIDSLSLIVTCPTALAKGASFVTGANIIRADYNHIGLPTLIFQTPTNKYILNLKSDVPKVIQNTKANPIVFWEIHIIAN